MFKVCLLISLAVAGICAQNVVPPNGAEGAPEPYSYGYETDTHAAAEQRDPTGKVTGYYTLTDADGRSRRVEYVADEGGFRAKVETNEVGTKSENSADVEVLASPPTREQLVYQPAVQQQTVAVQPQRVSQQVAAYPQGAAYSQRATSAQYVQQPQVGYGYYPGYGYGSQYGYGVAGSPYGYGVAGSPYGYGYNNLGYSNGYYSSYNNHLPSSYYKSVGSSVQPAKYASTGVVGQYGQTRLGTYQTVVPQTVAYQTVPQVAGYQTRTSGASSNLLGSSNYIVLKKRATKAEATPETTK